MKLYIRECRRIATSIIFYLFIAILVFSWFQNFRGVTKTEIDWANGISPANIGVERALLSKPSHDDDYFGSKTSEDNPEAIMTGVTRALLAEYESNSYAIVLLFGPMYHLKKRSDQIKALAEAKRVTKKEGIILVSYCMNDYAIITHGFIEDNIKENIKNQQINKNFKILENGNPLYDYVRIEDINEINKITKMQ